MNTASGPQSAVAAELGSASTVPPPATGTPETAAGGGTAALHRHRLAVSPRPSSDCTLSIGAYNCEGLLSAFEYINDQILPLCDILVLSESWLSRAEEAYPSRILAAAGHSSHQVLQTFAMETPPGAGEGRRRGGMTLICRRRPGLTFTPCACDSPRLCGVTALINGLPVLSVIGCYMPYWDGIGVNSVEYATVSAKLDATIAALRPSALVVVAGDFNCALPQMPAATRPPQWHHLRGFTLHSITMQDLLDHNELAVAEFQFPQLVDFTYARGECRSHIDHIAVPTALLSRVADCQILPQHPENLSPHLPLVCSMLVDTVQPSGTDSTAVDKDVTGPGAVLLSWDCADRVETYNKTLTDLLINQLPACGDSLDALDATITRCLHAAA